MAKINDFGEKIGGARKDLWKHRGLQVSDLSEMTDVEISSYVKKDNVWPRPDWVDLVSNGTPQVVAYWQNEMRKAIPPKPIITSKEGIENYVKTVNGLKDAVMAVKDMQQASDFYNNFIKPNYLFEKEQGWRKVYSPIPEAAGVFTDKFIKAIRADIRSMINPATTSLFGIPEDKKVYTRVKNGLEIYEYDENNVRIKEEDKRIVLAIGNLYSRHYYYLYDGQKFSNKDEWQQGTYFIIDSPSRKPLHINISSKEEAEILVELVAKKMQEKHNELAKENKEKNKGKGSKRKVTFTPPQLQNISREGPEYRNGSVTGEMYLNELKFKGGEYGNWLNGNDRQTSLDMGYDALRDLARILSIRPEDVSLDGTLSIAFGSRGRGGVHASAAHYEPDRQVINLTKMSGAGCLAHEWAHALDHAIGISLGSTKMASELKNSSIPKAFKEVMYSIKYKEEMVSVEEARKDFEPRINKAKSQLYSWIKSSKPRNMTEQEVNKWDSLVQELVDNVNTFSGLEYQNYRLGESKTNSYIEALSTMKKGIDGHVIPKDKKCQIALWASSLNGLNEQVNNLKDKEHTVLTDYYKDSGEFDNLYAKEKHGYWQSNCEIFARAFDCYVSDKLKESGYKSDFLTAHADSFVISDGKGGYISAIPQGEERRIINEKFDLLIEQLKERGFFQDYVEPTKETELGEDEFDWNIPEKQKKSRRSNLEPEKPVEYKQMTFADLIENAATRSGSYNSHRASSPGRNFRSRN